MIVVILVEIINLWNLSNITEGVYSLMFDFIALGIIAEFDDYFIEIYRDTNLEPIISTLELKFDRTKSPKRHLPNLKEIKLEKLMQKIRENLKDFGNLCDDQFSRNMPTNVEAPGETSYCGACFRNCKKTCW